MEQVLLHRCCSQHAEFYGLNGSSITGSVVLRPGGLLNFWFSYNHFFSLTSTEVPIHTKELEDQIYLGQSIAIAYTDKMNCHLEEHRRFWQPQHNTSLPHQGDVSRKIYHQVATPLKSHISSSNSFYCSSNGKESSHKSSMIVNLVGLHPERRFHSRENSNMDIVLMKIVNISNTVFLYKMRLTYLNYWQLCYIIICTIITLSRQMQLT